jgi:putative acetyltransferase
MKNEKAFRFERIQPGDNARVAYIIRTVMTEFGAVGTGYSIEDPEVDAMYEAYANDRACFYVLKIGNETVGCGGLGPLLGGEASVCELKKMYFLKAGRGLGAGKALIQLLFEEAKKRGYEIMYLETIASMEGANKLYQKMGFQSLTGPMGNTGHSACGVFYALNLK